MSAYPVSFAVAYPERPLNRLTTAFRIFTAIPILIVLDPLPAEVPAHPDAREGLNRWLPLIKWLLAIPHGSCWRFSTSASPSP
jgi:hypothetical protein